MGVEQIGHLIAVEYPPGPDLAEPGVELCLPVATPPAPSRSLCDASSCRCVVHPWRGESRPGLRSPFRPSSSVASQMAPCAASWLNSSLLTCPRRTASHSSMVWYSDRSMRLGRRPATPATPHNRPDPRRSGVAGAIRALSAASRPSAGPEIRRRSRPAATGFDHHLCPGRSRAAVVVGLGDTISLVDVVALPVRSRGRELSTPIVRATLATPGRGPGPAGGRASRRC